MKCIEKMPGLYYRSGLCFRARLVKGLLAGGVCVVVSLMAGCGGAGSSASGGAGAVSASSGTGTAQGGGGIRDSVPTDLSAMDTAYGNASDRVRELLLRDGTSVRLHPHSVIRLAKAFNQSEREIRLDGEAVFMVKTVGGKPFTVVTRDLHIVCLGTQFRVDCFSSKPGGEVDLLSGRVKVCKTYHSDTDNEPEVLDAGDMVMINRDIDLMEKEKMNPEELRQVRERL